MYSLYLLPSLTLKYYVALFIIVTLFQYPLVLGAGPAGVPGDSAYVYIAYASDAIGTGFTTTFNAALNFIAIKHTTVAIALPAVGDFVGLWFNYKGATGLAGANAYCYIAYASDDIGTGFTQVYNAALSWFAVKATTVAIPVPAVGDFAGLWQKFKADHSYLYIAYASDAIGTNFTMVFNAALDYIAVLPTTTPIAAPVVGDFAGLWKNYKGIQGIQGVPGTDPQCHSAAVDPAVTDDSASGYSINSLWWNTATHKLFSAESVGVGTATWHQIHPPLGADVSGQVGDAHTVDGAHASEFIRHDLTTALSDFLCGNGAGAYIKKTLTEVKTILGLGSAAYTSSGDYVPHSLTTALNDFLCGNGSGAYIKKTLAEVKTILGLGSAAYTASGDYAVAAKGVTNGDSHDHNGGDGAAIAAAATTFAATAKVLGRKSAGAGAGEECSLSETLDMIGTPVRGGQLARGAVVWEQKAIGSYGQVWKSNGVDPEWGTMAGGINYCLNPDAGADTSGWAIYDDGAVAVPVNGDDGAPDSTWTRDTTVTALRLPLRGVASFKWSAAGAADRQGEGVSYNFTIDPIDQTKMCRISFDWMANQVVAEGDFICYIYDVTNSVLIQPTPYKFPGTVAYAKNSWFCEFQSSYNSVNYRFIMHRAIATAQDFNLWFDNFKFGPQDMKQGVPVTDWQSYTPTGGWNTNVTYTGKWRRVGDSIEIEVKILCSGAPNAANCTFSLPSGFSIDTTKIVASSETINGYAYCLNSGVQGYLSWCRYSSATTLQIVTLVHDAAYSGAALVTESVPFAFNNVDHVIAHAFIPVLGWSSNCQVSADAETRVVLSKVNVNGGGVALAPNASFVKIPITVKIYDTHNSWDFVTNYRYTATISGYYQLSCVATFSNVNILAGIHGVSAYKNGVRHTDLAFVTHPHDGTFMYLAGSGIVFLNAGDYIEFWFYGVNNNSVNTLSLFGTPEYTHFNIMRISGPSQIAASEKVYVTYNDVSAQVITNNSWVRVDFTDKVNDSHGSVTVGAGAWKFTFPRAGVAKYSATAMLNVTAGAFSGGTSEILSLRCLHNAVVKRENYKVPVANEINPQCSIIGAISGNAGDTIYFEMKQTSGNDNPLIASGVYNIVDIWMD